jgi:hypothetical protein
MVGWFPLLALTTIDIGYTLDIWTWLDDRVFFLLGSPTSDIGDRLDSWPYYCTVQCTWLVTD